MRERILFKEESYRIIKKMWGTDYNGVEIFKGKLDAIGSKSRSSWSKVSPSTMQNVAMITSIVFRTVIPVFRSFR